jgi:hypothetical protein
VVATLFFFPVPLLWIMKYKPVHTFELTPLPPERVIEQQDIQPNQGKNKKSEDRLSRLSQLKYLLDHGVLTQDEFDAEKKKILAE